MRQVPYQSVQIGFVLRSVPFRTLISFLLHGQLALTHDEHEWIRSSAQLR